MTGHPRRRAPDPLALDEPFLRILESVPDHVMVFDLDGVIRYINWVVPDVEVESVVGTPAVDFVPEGQAHRIEEAMAQVRATGRQGHFDVSYERRDGEILLFESRIGPVRRDGELVGYVVISTDATARRRQERDLRESEERYRSLIEDQAEFVVRWKPGGTRTFVNDAYCRYWGAAREELVGTSFFPLVSPEDRERVREELGEITPKAPVRSGEHRVIRPDGSTGWNEWIDRGFFASDGRLVELQSVGRDITERKAAEVALRVSEEKYRSLFEEAKDAIFVSTPEGRLLDINPAGLEMLGVSSKEELREIDIGGTFYVDPSQRDELKRRLARDGFLRDFELDLRRCDGRRITVLESASVIRGEAGEVLAYRGILHDVTERRQLESRLRGAQRMEAVGKLAGGVAHDFNNLLTVILGNAELLREELGARSAGRGSVEEILRAARRAAGMTSNLLAFGRRQVLMPEVMSLNEIVSETHRMLERLIGEDIELVTDLHPRLSSVRADPGQMQQVLLNLAFNARDAMPRGGRLAISTRDVDWAPNFAIGEGGRQGGAWVLLRVEDTGVGIPADQIERIFEPFFTTKNPEEGTGLGLASVYGIVKQSGGYITVESETGRGSRFDVFLPRVGGRPHCAVEPNAEAAAGRGAGTVLLVEDETGVRELASRVLERSGYHVLVAADGASALEAAAGAGQIDLVITDIVMPGMSGFELVERLTGIHAGVRVLFMTGHSEEAVRRQGESRHGRAMIQKPFAPRELLERVRATLQRTAAAPDRHR